MKLWVVVTAAGSSRRMGSGQNKLLLEVHGKPLLVHTLENFQKHPAVAGILLSAAVDQMEAYQQMVEAFALSRVHKIVPGGAERQDSIRNALEALEAAPEDVVAIHDGARPCLEGPLLDRLLAALPACQGVLPMVSIKDTVKRVDLDGVVIETLRREELFAAQTPQLFRYSEILEAHQKARQENFLGTDDCSLVERYGGKILRIEGSYSNLKVTTPEDVAWLKDYLEMARRA